MSHIENLKLAWNLHKKWYLWLVKWKECQGKFAIVKDQLFLLTLPYVLIFPFTYRFASARPLSNAPVFASICFHSWTSRLNGALLLIATTSMVCVSVCLITFNLLYFSIAMHFYLQMRKAVNWFFFATEAPINESLTYSLTHSSLFMKMLQQQ